MSLARSALFAALCGLPFTSVSAIAAPASGKVGGWTVVDAVAWRDRIGTHLVFSDKPFDRAAMAGDRKLDSSDVMSHQMSPLKAQTYEIRLDPDGSLGGVSISLPGGTSTSYSSAMVDGLKLARNEDAVVAGSFVHDGANLTFDVPVQVGELARPGKALPADGGEPGKILIAQTRAIETGDYDALTELSPPADRDAMIKGKGKPEGAMEMAVAKVVTPSKVRVTGGSADGDHAWLDFTGQMDGKPVLGMATVERSEGRWYVRNIEVRLPD